MAWTQFWMWWCGVRLRWVVQEWDIGLARSQTLPSVTVLATGRIVSWMVARSVSVVMRTNGLCKLTPCSGKDRKSGLSRMNALKVVASSVRWCVGGSVNGAVDVGDGVGRRGGGVGGREVGDWGHVSTRGKVPVAPHPERWGQDCDPLALVKRQVGAVELVGAEGLLGRCEDPRPR